MYFNINLHYLHTLPRLQVLGVDDSKTRCHRHEPFYLLRVIIILTNNAKNSTLELVLTYVGYHQIMVSRIAKIAKE